MASNPNKPKSFIERQRPLVIGARVWLALVKLTYEMSLTHALPLPFPSPAHYPYDFARELLDHPLSNIYDARLVVSVEMLQVRETVFRPYETAARESSELDNKLRAVNQEIHSRYEYWIDYYRRHGVPTDHLLVKELTGQRAYATIYTNSCALYGVRDASDVVDLSFERRQWLGSALRAAAFLVSSVGSGGKEKYSEFANHYFHVGIVATARYLIRMTGLLPEVCDLYQVSYDIDKLLLKLPACESWSSVHGDASLISQQGSPARYIALHVVERARGQRGRPLRGDAKGTDGPTKAAHAREPIPMEHADPQSSSVWT
jgi:hypothetical protein